MAISSGIRSASGEGISLYLFYIGSHARHVVPQINSENCLINDYLLSFMQKKMAKFVRNSETLPSPTCLSVKAYDASTFVTQCESRFRSLEPVPDDLYALGNVLYPQPLIGG